MQEASATRAEMITEMRRQAGTSEGQERSTTDFAQIMQSIEPSLISDRLAAKTVLRYKKIFGRLFGEFRALKFPSIQNPRQLRSTFFEEYKKYYCVDLNRSKGWRAESIIVKAIVNRMHLLGFCSKDVVDELKKIKRAPEVEKEYPNICTSKIKELMAFVKGDRPDFYRPIYFMLRTGRRIEETTLIEKNDVLWKGINPVRIDIRAKTTKTKKRAPLDLIDDDMANFIRGAFSHSKEHKAPFLFLNRKGKKCNQRRICKYLKQASAKVCGESITPHYFRHRFFTECCNKNVPMKAAMAVSGLKDIKVLMGYYSHATEEGNIQVFNATKI